MYVHTQYVRNCVVRVHNESHLKKSPMIVVRIVS